MHVYPASLKLRWLTANCWEIKLPDGTTIITDPFIPTKDHPMEKWHHYDCGVGVNDLERADYAIIGHPHADHLGSLKDLFDRFSCRVLGHSVWAYLLCTELQIPEQMILPYDNGAHYEFNSFKLDTFVARHSPGFVGKRNGIRHIDQGTEYEVLNDYGALYNTNYILSTKSNLRICFCAGVHDETEFNYLKDKGVNLILCQCGSMAPEPRMASPDAVDKAVQQAADVMINSGAELMMPTHQERFSQDQVEVFVEKVNEALDERGYHGRMFAPVPTQWYSVGMDLSAI